MLKILMVLTLAAIIVSGVFGWKNRDEFVENRKKKQSLNKETETLINDSFALAQDIKKTKHVALEGAWVERNDSHTKLSGSQRDLMMANNTLSGLKSEVETKQADYDNKKQKLDMVRAKIEESIGPVDLDQIEPRYEQLKKKVEDQRKQLALTVEEHRVNTDTLTNRIKDREGLEEAQVRRDNEFKLNVLTARVLNVRNDFGLLEFSAGSEQNVAGSTDLAVVRNGIVICRINLVKDPEPNRSLAEIQQNTLIEGAQVQVGDQVVVRTARE